MDFKRMRWRNQKPQRISTAAYDFVTRELLLGVWGLKLGTTVNFPSAYLDHCQELRSLSDEDGFRDSNFDRNDVIDVVKLVQSGQDQTVEELTHRISLMKPRWMKANPDEQACINILDFVLRLWLFIEPDLSDKTNNLTDVVAKVILSRPVSSARDPRFGSHAATTVSTPATRPHQAVSKPENGSWLSSDFCEKSLTRKGGFKLEWTSYLTEHLTVVGDSRLRLFRHTSALHKFAGSTERLLFPDGFLEETEATLALLFDPSGDKSSKRAIRIQKMKGVDIEAAIQCLMDAETRLDLGNYPYWQDRLRKVQRLYNEAQPKAPKQWWFDRRNRLNWTTFWIAFVVFILTLIFGVISSVTGIVQAQVAIESWKQSQQPQQT